MPAQRLKHVYSAITLTSNDLATVFWWWGLIAEPVLRANAYHLTSPDEVADVLREDTVIDALSVVATRDQQWASFAYQPGYVLIEISDEDPLLREAFSAVTDLLAAKAKNGFAQCLIELSPPGTWRAPTRRTPAVAAPSRLAAKTTARAGTSPAGDPGATATGWWSRAARRLADLMHGHGPRHA
jgi:hypothetical protein